MRLRMTLPAVLLFSLSLACSREPTVSADEDAAAIDRAMREWAAAYQAGDLARTMAFITEDAVLVPPGEDVVSGADAIEAWSRQVLDQTDFEEITVITGDVRVAGDWAVSHGSWAMRARMDTATVVDTTRNVVIWERQPDGSWKAAYDVWNLRSR